MTTREVVTVLIPARNEEADIGDCLRHISTQDWGGDRLQVVLVDGASDDRTVEIATKVARESGVDLLVVDNPQTTTPSSLNLGLRHAAGRIVCRVDARSLIPPHYVRTCVELLDTSPDRVVVGGAQVAIPPNGSALAVGIARALNNSWAMGGSRDRRGAASGPADTVYLGSFRTGDLRDVGGWDERMLTNQDFELNERLGRFGVVWFEARLGVGYLPRQRLVDLGQQYVRFGRWKVRYWRATSRQPRGRQIALLIAPLVGMAGVWALGRSTSWRFAGLAAVVGGCCVEVAGSSRPRAGVAGHAYALVAMVTVTAAWTAGVWLELLGVGNEPS